jgi:hypothetical protein
VRETTYFVDILFSVIYSVETTEHNILIRDF